MAKGSGTTKSVGSSGASASRVVRSSQEQYYLSSVSGMTINVSSELSAQKVTIDGAMGINNLTQQEKSVIRQKAEEWVSAAESELAKTKGSSIVSMRAERPFASSSKRLNRIKFYENAIKEMKAKLSSF